MSERTMRRLISALLGLAACAAPKAREPVTNPLLAEVEGDSITLEDAERYFESRHEGHLSLLAGKTELSRLVDRLIDHRLLVREGYALGLDRDPEVAKVVEQERLRLRRQALLEREIDKKVVVTDPEIEAFHARSGDRFEASVILVATKEEAEDIARLLAAGGDFEALARERSLSASAALGGREPVLSREMMDAAMEAALDRLEPKGVSPPIPGPEGARLVRLETRSTEPLAPLDDGLRARLREGLAARKKATLGRALEDRMLSATGAREDLELIQSIATGGTDPEGKPAEDERVVAEVGGEKLLVKDLSEANGVLAEMEPLPRRRFTFLWRRVRDWEVEKALQAALENDPLSTKDELKLADVRETTMDAKLRHDFVYTSAPPGEADARAYYEAHPEEFRNPLQIELYHIFHRTRDEADRSAARLEAGERFEDVARERSEDKPTGVHGGNVGWIRPGDMLVELEATIRGLRSGERTGVVESSKGFHILWAKKRVEERLLSFEEARAAATKEVAQKTRADALKTWIGKLRERAAFTVHPEGIETALALLESRERQKAAPAAASPEARQ